MINIKPDVLKFLKELPPKQYKQIAQRILSLGNEEPHDSRHLSGYPGCFRIDVGEYRVIYTRKDNAVLVPLVGKRNGDEVYRDLKNSNL